MPKNAFFNLSTEKRNRILEAASNEFEQNIFEEVSIKRIIDEAEIPRGSFYQYFYNIEDLFEYKIQLLQKEIFKENFEINWVEGSDFLRVLKDGLKKRMNLIFGTKLVQGDFMFMKKITESDEAKRFFVRSFGIYNMIDDGLLDKIHQFNFPHIPMEEMSVIIETLFATIEHSLYKMMNREKSIEEMKKEIDMKFSLIERLVAYE